MGTNVLWVFFFSQWSFRCLCSSFTAQVLRLFRECAVMIERGYSGNSEYSTNANLQINSGAVLQKHLFSARENGCLSKEIYLHSFWERTMGTVSGCFSNPSRKFRIWEDVYNIFSASIKSFSYYFKTPLLWTDGMVFWSSRHLQPHKAIKSWNCASVSKSILSIWSREREPLNFASVGGAVPICHHSVRTLTPDWAQYFFF